MSNKKRDRSGKRRTRVVFSIGAKLVISFVFILFTVLFIINKLSSNITARNLEMIAEDTNATVNNFFAIETENRFNSVRKDVYLLLDFIRITGRNSYAARQASTAFFERSYFTAAVCVPGYIELVDDHFFITNNANPGLISSWVSRESSRIERARAGEPVISNPSVELGIPLIAMFFPWQQNDREETVVILFSTDGLADVFGTRNNFSFVVNMDGDVLIHSNPQMVLNGSNVSEHPLFTAFSETENLEIRTTYSENGVKYIGAGKKISLANIMIFSSAEYELPSEMVSAISRRILFLIGSIIFISIILVWLLSKTITVPVNHLIEAVTRLGEGQFDQELGYRFPDEIGVLSIKFNEMGKTLAEKSGEKREPARKKSRK